jgi:hypothetical protein
MSRRFRVTVDPLARGTLDASAHVADCRARALGSRLLMRDARIKHRAQTTPEALGSWEDIPGRFLVGNGSRGRFVVRAPGS